MGTPKPRQNRILFIDAHDSFTNNIISLLETRLEAKVYVWKIGLRLAHQELIAALSHFDAVVAGPGPGSPTNDADTGLMNEVWKLEDEALLPILGICLGFQNLAISFGASIERLKGPKHGRVCRISHRAESIFQDVQPLRVTCYHSLQVTLGFSAKPRHGVLDSDMLWEPTETCPDLQPLAWDLDDKVNGPVLMALRHLKKPFWGLQYHPESICTDEESSKVIDNWWAETMRWHWRRNQSGIPARLYSDEKLDPGLQERIERVEEAHFRRRAFTSRQRPQMNGRVPKPQANGQVLTETVDLEAMKPVELCVELGLTHSDLILLDSAAIREDTGRYSIIGIIEPAQTITFEYTTGSRTVTKRGPGKLDVASEPLTDFGGDIYQYLADYIESKRANDGSPASPFWGGLLGYITYEMCLGSVSIHLPVPNGKSMGQRSRPGMTFAYVERSLVYDHHTSLVYVQSIRAGDAAWVQGMKEQIKQLCDKRQNGIRNTHAPFHALQPQDKPPGAANSTKANGVKPQLHLKTTAPTAKVYQNKVRHCQEYIRAGDSYELCLTGQAEVKVSRSSRDDYIWPLYQTLRTHNPAPFGAYFRVGRGTLLSCSPERFLRWDRNGFCQMRPIKGTVKKGPGLNRLVAEDILSQPKEQAENLMIVDLIRHDMHGVLGSGAVRVKSLMKVEEYETVFQLVTVIEGPWDSSSGAGSQRFAGDGSSDTFRTGIGLLAASLPPGSMTGAPKQRSCELLREIEDEKPRGIYSGVVGYMCVGGGGDFSVVIRSAFKWEADDPQERQEAGDSGGFQSNGTRSSDEQEGNADCDIWRIGAGGAVTALSTPEAEWEEMQTKLKSTLDPFTRFFNDLPN